MLFDQGKLTKMKVQAFEAAGRGDDPPQLSQEDGDTYIVQVNPNSYTVNHAIVYSMLQGQGTSARDANYSSTEPTTLEFSFLFDGTGIIPPSSPVDGIPLVGAVASLFDDDEFNVMEEIGKFDSVVYDHTGEVHRPRKVQLNWGDLIFPCALTSLTYQFTLFKPDGSPLRTQANCSFQHALTDCERELRENNQSPDLTHVREVREGDTLPFMAHRIYGDPKHYIEVARVNKIVNFRSLRAGSRVTLPPIAKDAKR